MSKLISSLHSPFSPSTIFLFSTRLFIIHLAFFFPSFLLFHFPSLLSLSPRPAWCDFRDTLIPCSLLSTGSFLSPSAATICIFSAPTRPPSFVPPGPSQSCLMCMVMPFPSSSVTIRLSCHYSLFISFIFYFRK